MQVGLGDLELPPLPTSKRMRVKSGVRRMCVSNGDEDGAKGPAMLDKDCVEAPSQDGGSCRLTLFLVDMLFHVSKLSFDMLFKMSRLKRCSTYPLVS